LNPDEETKQAANEHKVSQIPLSSLYNDALKINLSVEGNLTRNQNIRALASWVHIQS
jgi:hypothetical protein